jgi:RHS repeat-associated protein
MPPAAKHFDPILGIDVHIVQPPGPVPPVPVPHPHTGMVLDPCDYAPFIGGTVKVGGLQRAQAGTETMMIPKHIPIGGVFVKPPGSEGEVFMGSSTVAADGDAFTYLALPVLTCQDVGIPAPGRPKGSPPKSLVLPTTVVLSIPLPVSVGGSPTVSLMALGMRAGMAALGAALKKLKGLAKNSDKMKKVSSALHNKAAKVMDKLGIPPNIQRKVHDAICSVTGHPVDIASGRVFTRHTDFALPGPIPFELVRAWHSTSTHDGELGHGWHHSYDMTLFVDEGIVLARLDDGRYVAFPEPAVGESHHDRGERLACGRDAHGFWLRDIRGRTYRFVHGPGTPAIEHRLNLITDDAGHRIVFVRDLRGRLETIVDCAGRRLRVRTDDRGRLVGLDAPDPDDARRMVAVVRWEYDEAGELVRAANALGHATTYAYRDRLLVRETDPNGLSFHFEYDALRRCVHTWGDGGIYERRLVYDDEAAATSVTDSRGFTRVHHHDGAVVHRVVDPLGGVSQTLRDDDYRPIAHVDPNGATTRFQHDEWGDQIGVQREDGGKIVAEYDSRHRIVRLVNEIGATWTWAYDEGGRVRERTDPLGRTWTIEHGSRHERHVDPDGGVTAVERDEAFNVVMLRTPDGASARWEYDGWGRPICAIGPTGAFEQRAFDLLGRPVRVHDLDGSRRDFVYDAGGNLLAIRRSDRETRIAYQGTGRVVSRTEAGVTMRFGYDTEENLLAIVDAHGHARRFELDANGRKRAEIDATGRRREFVRDAAGRVVRVERPGGRFTAIAYDKVGRIVEKRHHDDTFARYRWRADGALVEATNADAKLVFDRDPIGRIVRESCNGHWVASEYGTKGKRTRVTSSLGADQHIELDIMGEAMELEDGAFRASFERDVFGLETRRSLPGDIATEWTRDAVGREIEQRIVHGPGTLRTRAIAWGVEDRIGAEVDADAGPTRHGHNVLGGLAWSQYPDGSTDLRMPDAVGNLYETADRTDRSYGPSGELLVADRADGRTRYEYDDEGLLVTKTGPGDARWSYAWNGAGRLVGVTRPEGDDVRFSYDAIGRRIAKHVGDRTEHTVWDFGAPLHEWTTKGDDTDGPAIDWIFTPDSLAPLGKRVGDEVFGIVCDRKGTPQAMFDVEGRAVWSADLDAYGRVRRLEGDAEACPFRWPGQREDPETGLYYNRFRYYDPDAGVYISPDPIGVSGGLRPYAYVDDVLVAFDPFGLVSDNKKMGDAAEAAARDELAAEGKEVLGSMENNSGHGVDLVVRDKQTGKLEVVEVKANGSPLNPDQKKGADWFAQNRAERCMQGEGAWKSPKGDSKKLANEILDEIAENGEIKGTIRRYDVTKVGNDYVATLKKKNGVTDWVKCS